MLVHDIDQRLQEIDKTHSAVKLALSLGAEDMLLLDRIEQLQLGITAFVLDTGRMFEQSYTFLQRVRDHYSTAIEIFAPQHQAIEHYSSQHGPNAIYQSLELRQACCTMRKSEPLARALANADAWITGQRRKQSPTRSALPWRETDLVHAIAKYNPLAEMDSDTLWNIIRSLGIPTHPLHEQGLPSIGCAPCTRAIKPGEDERAGRWWWENPNTKECGIHR